MSDTAFTASSTTVAVMPARSAEAWRFVGLTVVFFAAVFGGLAAVLTLAHYLTAGVF